MLPILDITDAATAKLKENQAEGKVIVLYSTSYPDEPLTVALGLGVAGEKDLIVESNGLEVYMSPKDAELIRLAVIDYVDDERGRGFLVHTAQEGSCGMISCDECLSCNQ